MVLNEVVASARPLTGAEYGVIATVDENGEPRDFVTSGMTDEQRRALETWPGGLRLFARPRPLGAPLRLLDLDVWVRALPRALWHSDGRHDPTTRMLQPRFRAVSTFFASYYALFHRLVDEATRMMISGGLRKGIRQCLSRPFFHHDMKELCTPLASGTPRQRHPTPTDRSRLPTARTVNSPGPAAARAQRRRMRNMQPVNLAS